MNDTNLRDCMSADDLEKSIRALRRATDYAGNSYRALARLITDKTGHTISGPGIHRWIAHGIPAHWAIRIEEATGGAVTREELRPDLYRGLTNRRSA